MKALTITAHPKAEAGWVHRFRNFGEAVYVQFRASSDVNIAEIDAAFDEFHICRIPDHEASSVAGAVATLSREHHLDDSMFVVLGHAPVYHEPVGLVLDVTFGERLFEVAGRHPIWVVCSDVNKEAVQHLREPNQSYAKDVTIWSSAFDVATEQDWLGILSTLSIHYGVFASDPPMNKLTIWGAAVTAPATTALRAYGFETVLPTASGLIALQLRRGLTSRCS